MAVQTISGASADLLTVDPGSKAARATIYGPDGEPYSYVSSRNRGVAIIAFQHAATTTAPAVVWSIRSITDGRTIYVRKLWLQLYHAGAGAASEMQYELVKGTGCTATTGSAVTPLLKRTSYTNPDVEVKMATAGITLTGVTLGAPFCVRTWPRVAISGATADPNSEMTVLDCTDQPVELTLNEVLVVRLKVDSLIGDGLYGGCEFCGG
jgi:hypothetical protein